MLFDLTEPTLEEEALRLEVRAFLARARPPGAHRPGLGMDAGHSPEFSEELASHGWLGMAVPPEYGGQGRTAVDRFVVVEELLAAGAPIRAHWFADRQTAPSLLHYGTEAQRRRFLPEIAAGRCFFALGLSEPDAGSDLASVRTSATRTDGGWLVNGTKIWTSSAHLNHFFVALCRTSSPGEDKHEGLSQLIVDLHAPGVSISPIALLDGSHHFNEVAMSDVFVPDDMLLGEEGRGWAQVTSELAYERSGPDRYLSSFPVIERFLAERVDPESGDPGDDVAEVLGELAARLFALRQLSFSVARALDAGSAPEVQAALVKDLGTAFEQDSAELLQSVAGADPFPESPALFESLLAELICNAPAYTIRGGTSEVLRTIVARGLRPGS